MIEIALASSIMFQSIVGFRDEADPTGQTFYNSGVGDKDILFNALPRTGFAVVRVPFRFKYNAYHDSLPPGVYEIEPVFKEEKPVLLNFRKIGKVIATSTVSDYSMLNYTKTNPSSKIELFNHGRHAKINILFKNYKISSIVKVINTPY